MKKFAVIRNGVQVALTSTREEAEKARELASEKRKKDYPSSWWLLPKLEIREVETGYDPGQ